MLSNKLDVSNQISFCEKQFEKVLKFDPSLNPAIHYSSFDHKLTVPMDVQYQALKEKERICRRVMSLYVKKRITPDAADAAMFKKVFRCIQNMQIHSVVLETDIDKLNQEHARSVLIDTHNIVFGDYEFNFNNKHNKDVTLQVIKGFSASPLVTYHIPDSELRGVDVDMLRQVLQDKANLFVGDNCLCVAHQSVKVVIFEGQSVTDDPTDIGSDYYSDSDSDSDMED